MGMKMNHLSFALNVYAQTREDVCHSADIGERGNVAEGEGLYGEK
jgi:hypothetical protein